MKRSPKNMRLALGVVGCAVAVQVKKADVDERPDNVAQGINFHQRLLVCNAVADWGDVTISRNDIPTKSHEALPFNGCRYIDGKIFDEDRIKFTYEKEAVSGYFRVEELPQSDSELLLIAQKRNDKDKLLTFQSFAFPASQPDSAQVAFLNAITGDADKRLRMSDASGSRKSATREEQVLYNRVYSIEAGQYQVEQLSKLGATKLNLKTGRDYVVLKTGTPGSSQLIVFPPEASSYPPMVYVAACLGPIFVVAAAMYYMRRGKA